MRIPAEFREGRTKFIFAAKFVLFSSWKETNCLAFKLLGAINLSVTAQLGLQTNGTINISKTNIL